MPLKSRTAIALNPAKDWDWPQETQSRILAKLDEISCSIVNMNLKKGKKHAKPGEQFQPDYVKAAKEKAEMERRQRRALSDKEREQLRAFWAHKNPKARTL